MNISYMSQPNISPLASVHPEAKLGAGVIVHPFAVIEENTEVGEGCIIESHASRAELVWVSTAISTRVLSSQVSPRT